MARPKGHGSRAWRDLLKKHGTAGLGLDGEMGKLAHAYKMAWRKELAFPGWGLAQDADLEDACVGFLRKTRALKHCLEADLNAPNATLATLERDTGANQERAALDRIRAAREAHSPVAVQIMQGIRETPDQHDSAAQDAQEARTPRQEEEETQDEAPRKRRKRLRTPQSDPPIPNTETSLPCGTSPRIRQWGRSRSHLLPEQPGRVTTSSGRIAVFNP
jgi:hypothetical protein